MKIIFAIILIPMKLVNYFLKYIETYEVDEKNNINIGGVLVV